MAEIGVADTGPGIPEELRKDLFEKFVTGKHRNRGSGLGLAFCRLAVEAHGGEIWVDTSEEKGSVFRFTLPFGDSDAAPMDESMPYQLSLLGQDPGHTEEPLG
jgi:signal transduction histidine kinase